jgi:hypothetical protein
MPNNGRLSHSEFSHFLLRTSTKSSGAHAKQNCAFCEPGMPNDGCLSHSVLAHRMFFTST